MPVGGASLLVYFAERLFQPFELVTAHAKLVLPYNVQLAFGWSREIVASIEHALSDKPGEWRVSVAGSRANENWEMRIEGSNSFERSYTLTGAAG